MRSKSLRERRAIIAGFAGNVMEWYDFSVYGYFATIIGRHFFPAQDAVSSLIAAFGVFAAGFLMRPLEVCCSAISETKWAARRRSRHQSR